MRNRIQRPAKPLIHRVITHDRPHFDELVAIVLLFIYGSRMFRFPQEVEVEFKRELPLDLHNLNDAELEAKGVLLIGIGGGRFDEHATHKRQRIQGASATSLVAKALRIEQLPQLRELLSYTTASDLGGSKHGLEFASLVSHLNLMYPKDPDKVWEGTLLFLRAYLNQKNEFHVMAKKALAERGIIHWLKLGEKKFKVLSIQTDAPMVKAYAFSKECNAAVVVQRHSNCQVQVFGNPHHRLELTDAAVQLRLAELQARGGTPNPEADYSAEGTLEDVPAWHYFVEGNMLLNGSFTAPDVTPSRLSLEEATQIVIQNLRIKTALPKKAMA